MKSYDFCNVFLKDKRLFPCTQVYLELNDFFCTPPHGEYPCKLAQKTKKSIDLFNHVELNDVDQLLDGFVLILQVYHLPPQQNTFLLSKKKGRKNKTGVRYLKKEYKVNKQDLEAITESNVVQEFDRILGL